MIRILLILLLLASPAWGAGNDTEERCDELGSDCVCSEPLTVDEGTKINDFDPAGSTSKECRPGIDVIRPSSGSTLTSILGRDIVNSDAVAKPLVVGGDGYVQIAEVGGGRWVWNATKYTFTDGTWCQRYYSLHDPKWNCNSDCNFKFPRQSDGGVTGTNPGMQSGIGTAAGGGVRVKYGLGVDYTTATACQNSPDSGCTSGQKLIRTGDDIRFEQELQTGWARYEHCYDHNLTAQQVSDMNASYGSALTHPGADHIYMRARITIITGPKAGKIQLHGPGRLNFTQTIADTGRNTASKPFSTGKGSCGTVDGVPQACGHDWDDVWFGYMMMAKKDSVDTSFWIGAAHEVEGGIPAVPTPTESEGVVFDGVNLTMVMP